MPVGAPSRVAQHLEDRERTAQQRIVAARRPSPSRTVRARRRRRSRAPRARARCSRPTAACCAITSAATSTGIAAVYCTARALSADAEQLGRRRGDAGDVLRPDRARPAAQSDVCRSIRRGSLPLVATGRPLLRRAPDGDLLRAARRAAAARARAVLAGVDQRRRAGVARRGRRRGRRGVDVGEPAHVRARARAGRRSRR